MKKYGRILTASFLLAVFGVFTVGLPIVRYLCPMMNDEVAACPYSPQSKTTGLTLTSEAPACCGSYIVAERSTTPYTSVAQYVPDHPFIHGYTLPLTVTSPSFSSQPVCVLFASATSPPPLSEPLFVLNSSLLI